MKQIFLLFLLFSLIANAGEIQRLESIVNDIDKIKNELELEKAKNKELNKELKIYADKINSLNNQIKVLKSKLKSKKVVKKIVRAEKKCSLNTQIKEEKNQFPPLVMKEKYKNEQDVTYFQASTFRVNGEAKIYDSIDGSVVAVWSDKTSFTSNQRAGKWIKITGYFVNKIWQPATQDLWVKSSDVFNRSQVSE